MQSTFVYFIYLIAWSFITEHPDKRTVFKRLHNISFKEKYFVCFVDRNLHIVIKALNMLFARLFMLAMSFVKISFSSMVILRSFNSLLHFICLCSIANVILLLSIFDSRNIIWNLRGFATMLLTLNHFETVFVWLDNLWAASLSFNEREYMVVSSAKLQTFAFGWKILNHL